MYIYHENLLQMQQIGLKYHSIKISAYNISYKYNYIHQFIRGVHRKIKPFYYAAHFGHLDIIENIIKNHKTILCQNNISEALIIAVQNNKLNIVKFLVEYNNNIVSPLHYNNDLAFRLAVDKGHLDIVKYLYNAGAAVDTNDNQVLHYVILHGRINLVKFLINETNFHIWNKELIQTKLNKFLNINIKTFVYLTDLSRIVACRKIQRWFKRAMHNKYSPNSNYVKNVIKPHFESMQI